MPDTTPAQVRRAALLALVWYAADCARGTACELAQDALDALGVDYGHPDTARAYLEAAQRELASMEEGGAK